MLTHDMPNIVVSNYIAQVKREPGIWYGLEQEFFGYTINRVNHFQQMFRLGHDWFLYVLPSTQHNFENNLN